MKQLTLICLSLLFVISCLSSCEKDNVVEISPAELYQQKVDGSLVAQKEQWSTLSKSLDSMTTAMANLDPNYQYTGDDNPDLQYSQFTPDEFVKVPNAEGYQGYVDLGLSKKWAVQNVGKSASKYSKILVFGDYFHEEKPSAPTKPQEVSTVIPDNLTDESQLQNLFNQIVTEYETRLSELTKIYNEYKVAYSNYMAAYNRAVVEYKNYLFNEKYNFLDGKEYYFAWGSNKIMTEGPSPMDYYGDFSGYPMELSDSSNDAATALWGEGWATPSPDDVQELIQKCTWTSYRKGSHIGVIARGPNGKCLFFSTNFYQLDRTLVNYSNNGKGYYLTNKRDGSTRGGAPTFIALSLQWNNDEKPTVNVYNNVCDVLCGYSLRAIRK